MELVNLPLSIALPKAAYVALTSDIAPGIQPVDVLSRRVQLFLESLASGGVMLKPEQVVEIENNSGKTVRDGQDVVRATEAPAKKASGRIAIEVTIDPAWSDPLNEIARSSGRSLEDMLSDMWEISLQNNWAYNFTPAYPPIYIKDSDYDLLRGITEQTRPTGDEIVTAIRELQSASRRKLRVVQSVEPATA